jgi:F-type H+-transporting ATPase subunit delta
METSLLRNYATALYEEAQAEQQVPAVLEGLETLAQAIGQSPDTMRLAQHPGISVEEKVRLLLAPLGEGAPPVLGRFLGLTLERHRFADLPQLLTLFRAVRDEREGLQPVLAETAALLSAGQVRRLEAALARLLGRPVHVEQEVVPALIGGLRLHINSEVLDESLDGRLNRMQEFLSRPVPEETPSHPRPSDAA